MITLITLVMWTIFGLIVGSIAKGLHPGDDPVGWLPTLGIGIAGSFIGGFLHSLLGGHFTWNHPAGLVWSIVGGVIFCFAYSHYKARQK